MVLRWRGWKEFQGGSLCEPVRFSTTSEYFPWCTRNFLLYREFSEAIRSLSCRFMPALNRHYHYELPFCIAGLMIRVWYIQWLFEHNGTHTKRWVRESSALAYIHGSFLVFEDRLLEVVPGTRIGSFKDSRYSRARWKNELNERFHDWLRSLLC